MSRDNNFDILRLIAALLVVISHSFGILNKGEEQPSFTVINIQIIPSSAGLFIFFVLSGYLVTQSLQHSFSWYNYIIKRALRIFPALIVCNVLCIFLLGLFFCSLPFLEYLQQLATWSYLWYNTALYKNQFYLPGVFDSLKPANEINASLWTLTVEIILYAILLILFVLKAFSSKTIIAITGLLFIASTFLLHDKTFNGWRLEYYINFSIFFFEGSALYIFQKEIKWYWMLVCLILFSLVEQQWAQWLLLTGIVSSLIIFIGRMKQVISLNGNDVSYGLYIYAFPVQQILLITFGKSINPWLHIVLTVGCTLPFAYASWKLIEKPTLQLKHRL